MSKNAWRFLAVKATSGYHFVHRFGVFLKSAKTPVHGRRGLGEAFPRG